MKVSKTGKNIIETFENTFQSERNPFNKNAKDDNRSYLACKESRQVA